MPTPWDDAADAAFASDLAVDALYYGASGGSPTAVRVALCERRVGSDFGIVSLSSETARLDLRVGSVSQPRQGDRIVIAGVEWTVAEPPVRDLEGTVWTLYCYRGAT